MSPLRAMLRHVVDRTATDDDCACRPAPADDVLHVDATRCPHAGDLRDEPACRGTVVDALRRNPRASVVVETTGCTRRYADDSVRVLAAAASFAERVVHHDERLAALATTKPVRACREATERAGPVSDVAEATGFVDAVGTAETITEALRAYAGPAIAASRVAPEPPIDARLRESYDTPQTTVRIYESPSQPVATYHVEPLEAAFGPAEYELLHEAESVLADGILGDGDHVHHAAIRAAASGTATDGVPVDRLARVLRKHTTGYGVLDDLFADEAVTDVYVNAPADETVLRVCVDGESMRTNVTLTDDGASTLAARIRATSGRPFSRAAPLVDAVATGVGAVDRVRVAGVTDPVADGTAFAFRTASKRVWRLHDLVANDTLTPDVAAFLGLAVERGRSILVAGPRGAGKTTLLAALLWEIPASDRVLCIEDTPELPVDALQNANRDALALRTRASEDGAGVSPTDALRAALRFGDGALVVGEVRGSEAGVLYEAMRVGANSNAVLGTIHGDGGERVQERVVNDLGVPRSSFEATDLVATLGHTPSGRRLVVLEEVTPDGFATLYERTATGIEATPRIRRGNSTLVARLARPTETYADVRTRLDQRADAIRSTSAPTGSHGVRP